MSRRTLAKRALILVLITAFDGAISACQADGLPDIAPPTYSTPAPDSSIPPTQPPTPPPAPTVGYVFADSIPTDQRNAIKQGINIALAYFSKLGTPLQQSVTVQVQGEAKDCRYTATAQQHTIVVCGASDVWRKSSHLQRAKILVHELYHVVQLELGQYWLAPHWTYEGSAEYVAYSAVIDRKMISRAEANNQLGLSGRRPALAMIHSTLRELEAEKPWMAAVDAQKPIYALAYAAIELLVAGAV